MKFMKSCLAACALVTLSTSAFANLLVNGDFELPFSGVFTANYSTVFAGSNDITGWGVGDISVDVIIAPNYGGISGNSIDLAGTPGPGSISQTFTSVIGQFYELDFDYFRNGSPVGDLTVNFGTDTVTYQPDLNPAAMMATYYFQATTTSTTVRFASAGVSNTGPVIDNVSVTAVPEPQAYALALAAVALVGGLSRASKRLDA